MTTMTDAPPEQAEASASAPTAGADSQAAGGRPAGLLVGIGLNDATRERIRTDGGFEVSDDADRASAADIVAITTRSERGQVPRMPADVDPERTPIVVLCHPGGEQTAVELMQHGCTGVVAEGNEQALVSFVDPERHTTVLVEGFLENQGVARSGHSNRHHDPVTNLPEIASFEMRLGEFIEAGTPPNIVMMEITNLDKARERTDSRTVNLLRRRLASFYRDAASRYSSEVFSLGEEGFAVLDGAQLLVDPKGFATELIQITEAFRPAGVKLQLAVGAAIAGAEGGVMAIRDQAEQAVKAAAQTGESAYVTAEEVTALLASSTEFKVAELLVSMVDQIGPNPPGHCNRVADLAADIAREYGWQDRDMCTLRLAALMHEVGRIPLGDNAAPEDHESRAERGARYVNASSGPEIAEAIRYQDERWDGAGPAAIVEDDIPLSARIIAIAKNTDSWLNPPTGETALGPADVMEKLQSMSGSVFDPSLTETAIRLFSAS